MNKYRSLVAWQRAHDLALLVLRTVDKHSHPRSAALFDQIRRAVISIEANIVEGYALSTKLNFRRHLRIALGSAAEAECLSKLAVELGYLPDKEGGEILKLLDGCVATLFGLVRKLS